MTKRRVTIPIFIPHEGCANRCVFCNQWRVTGADERVTSESIKRTIERYLSTAIDRAEKIEIGFFGGSFTGISLDDQKRYFSAIRPYIERGIIDSVRISTRPDYIDRSKLEILKENRVDTVELGVQSFSDKVLKASGRGHSSIDSINAFYLLKENGFRAGIQLMPGLPEDTYAVSIQSAMETAELCPDDVRIYPTVVLKDTQLEKLFNEKNYTPMTLEEAVALCSEIYAILTGAGINIIRMGLHPMDLNNGDVIAGPYHEALGFMIKSRYRRGILEEVVARSAKINQSCDSISLIIPAGMKEEYIGMKRENILYLKKKFSIAEIDYKFADIENPKALL
ncbi:MAG: radical SAM protein [Leptospirales bacterium]|nr:radical SAM protein [Leptospirales bacterium]